MKPFFSLHGSILLIYLAPQIPLALVSQNQVSAPQLYKTAISAWIQYFLARNLGEGITNLASFVSFPPEFIVMHSLLCSVSKKK